MGFIHGSEHVVQFTDQVVHFRRRLNHQFDRDTHAQQTEPTAKISLRTSCKSRATKVQSPQFHPLVEEIRHHDCHHASRGRGSDPVVRVLQSQT